MGRRASTTFTATIAEHLSRHPGTRPSSSNTCRAPAASSPTTSTPRRRTAPIPASPAIGCRKNSSPRRALPVREFQWLGATTRSCRRLPSGTARGNSNRAAQDRAVVLGAFSTTHRAISGRRCSRTPSARTTRSSPAIAAAMICNLAMERGEIHGWTASWESITGTRPQWLTEKKVKMLVEFTIERQRGPQTCRRWSSCRRRTRRTSPSSSYRERRSRGACGRAGRAGRSRRGAAQGVRCVDAGQGFPRRCREAQAEYRSDRRRKGPRAVTRSSRPRPTLLRGEEGGWADERAAIKGGRPCRWKAIRRCPCCRAPTSWRRNGGLPAAGWARDHGLDFRRLWLGQAFGPSPSTPATFPRPRIIALDGLHRRSGRVLRRARVFSRLCDALLGVGPAILHGSWRRSSSHAYWSVPQAQRGNTRRPILEEHRHDGRPGVCCSSPARGATSLDRMPAKKR